MIKHVKVHHRNIPGIVEASDINHEFYVVEEYVNGETLEEKLENGARYLEKYVIEIVLQVCDALEFLHQFNPPIIHRDVKLSNIMISNDGIVKLIDYNAVRYYEEGVNKDTMLIGTVGYAAPEQFGFSQTDVRTDIYAVGIVLNHMLTGCHISEEICDGKCREIVKKCTQMDPNNRYQTVKELKEDLQDILEDKLVKSRTSKADNVLSLIKRVCFVLQVLFLISLITNYNGIASILPIINQEQLAVQIV